MIHGIVGYEQSIEIIFELVDFNPVFNVAPEPLFPEIGIDFNYILFPFALTTSFARILFPHNLT